MSPATSIVSRRSGLHLSFLAVWSEVGRALRARWITSGRETRAAARGVHGPLEIFSRFKIPRFARCSNRMGVLGRGHCARSCAAGFTLVELLVVTGLIVILVGGAAMALTGRGGEGAALANAQSLLSGLVGTTRAQAALHQTTARLIVYAQQPPAANADAAKYLRALQVLRQETLPNGTTVWVAVGDPVTLPTPVCVVPPAPVAVNHLRSGVTWNNNVATGPVSVLTLATGFNYRGQSNANVSQFFGVQGLGGRIYYLEFGSDGTVSSNTSTNPTKIALTTAILGGNVLPQFNNANGVRGLFVRKSGAISLVNDSTGF
ncbi:MAG: type II secretion system protein [Opitutus sp.]|nr:type II secretion system protein [Opitutus sp.]